MSGSTLPDFSIRSTSCGTRPDRGSRIQVFEKASAHTLVFKYGKQGRAAISPGCRSAKQYPTKLPFARHTIPGREPDRSCSCQDSRVMPSSARRKAEIALSRGMPQTKMHSPISAGQASLYSSAPPMPPPCGVRSPRARETIVGGPAFVSHELQA